VSIIIIIILSVATRWHYFYRCPRVCWRVPRRYSGGRKSRGGREKNNICNPIPRPSSAKQYSPLTSCVVGAGAANTTGRTRRQRVCVSIFNVPERDAARTAARQRRRAIRRPRNDPSNAKRFVERGTIRRTRNNDPSLRLCSS